MFDGQQPHGRGPNPAKRQPEVAASQSQAKHYEHHQQGDQCVLDARQNGAPRSTHRSTTERAVFCRRTTLETPRADIVLAVILTSDTLVTRIVAPPGPDLSVPSLECISQVPLDRGGRAAVTIGSDEVPKLVVILCAGAVELAQV